MGLRPPKKKQKDKFRLSKVTTSQKRNWLYLNLGLKTKNKGINVVSQRSLPAKDETGYPTDTRP